MANTIEIVIKQTGSGNAIADASKALGGLGGAAKGITGMLGGFASGLGNVATIAGGIVAANIFGKIVDGITGFVSTGLDAVGASQQLETSLKALLTQNLMYEQTTETVTAAVTKQIMSQEELGFKYDELTAKLATQKATYQEQQEAIRQLTIRYGDNGLAVIEANAKHKELALSIQKTEREIAGLSTTETKYTTSTKQAWQTTMDQAAAFKLASAQTQDLLDFVSKLAVVSPFETEDVENVTKYAIAAGMGVDSTKEFVPAFLDLAGAVGITSDSLGFAADQLFQVKKIGKLTEIDLRQLRRLGIDLSKIIGVEMGMSVEEFNKKAETTPEIFDELFASITKFSSNTFAGTAKEMATSVKGLQSTFADIFTIGARTFLRPLVDAMTPTVAAMASRLSDFVLGGDMAGLGKQAAAMLMSGFQEIQVLFAVFGNSFTGGVRLLLYKIGFNEGALSVVTDWIEKIKTALAIFQTGGLFGSGRETGQNGGLLRMLGLSDETVGILQGVFNQVAEAATNFITQFNAQMGSLTQADVLNTLATGFAMVVSGIVTGLNIIVPAVASVVSFFAANWPTIAATAMTAWTVLQAVFNGIVQGLTASVGPAIAQIGAAFTSLGISWADVGNALLTATGIVFAGIGVLIVGAISVVTGLVGAVAAAVGTMVQYWGYLMTVVSQTVAGVMVVVTSLQTFWTAVFAGDFVTAAQAAGTGVVGLLTVVTGVVAGIVTAVVGMGATIYSFFEGFINTIIGFWQGLFDTLVGGSIIPDMVTAIIYWFNTLAAPVMAIFEQLSGGITNVLGAVFGALTGGGEGGAGIDFTVLITTLTETLPAGVALLTETFTAFFAGVTAQLVTLTAGPLTLFITTFSTIYLVHIPTLTVSWLAMTATITANITALTAGPLTLFITTLATIYLTHIPTLTASWISMTAALTSQIAITSGNLTALIGVIAQTQAAGIAMTSAIVAGMSSVASKVSSAADKIGGELVQAIRAATKEFEKMAEAAKKAADSSKGAGGSAKAAGNSSGWQHGTGPGGFLVPPGFPNDSFLARLTSGERMFVNPTGGGPPGSNRTTTTNYYFNQTVNTRAESSSVIGDFRVMQMLLGT